MLITSCCFIWSVTLALMMFVFHQCILNRTIVNLAPVSLTFPELSLDSFFKIATLTIFQPFGKKGNFGNIAYFYKTELIPGLQLWKNTF